MGRKLPGSGGLTKLDERLCLVELVLIALLPHVLVGFVAPVAH